MTREHLAFVESGNAAERAGDAATALEYHQGIPMFARSAHRAVLAQLADLAEEMTPWLWARWAAYQCTRAEDRGTESFEIQRLALDYTLGIFYDDLLAGAYVAGEDPIPAIARIVGEDWAFHQLCTHDLDGLEAFLETMATDRLAEEGHLALAWAGARMGGYRIEPAGPGGLVVRDLANDRTLTLLDLGARVHAGEGGWVIGRLVPSGVSPGWMFDTRPLPVDEQTARETATGDGSVAWVAALHRAIRDGRFDRSLLRSEDRELATDVPGLHLVEVGTAPSALASTLEALGRGRDEVGRAAYRILRAVVEGTWGADDRAAHVAAAVLNGHGFAEARQHLVQRGHEAAWRQWAELVPEPARGRLELLARQSRDVAA